MNDTSVLLSIAGAVISALSMLIVGIIAFFVKYVLGSTIKRIDMLEGEMKTSSNQQAALKTQSESEQRLLRDVASRVSAMTSAIEEIRVAFAELNGHLRRNGVTLENEG